MPPAGGVAVRSAIRLANARTSPGTALLSESAMMMMPTPMAQPYCSMLYSSRSRRARYARLRDRHPGVCPWRSAAGGPVGNGKDQLSRSANWGVSSLRHGRHLALGHDVLYISQPGAHDGWLAWDGRAYEWMESD